MESGADTERIQCIMLAVTCKLLGCRNYFLLPFSVGVEFHTFRMFIGKPIGQGRAVCFLGCVPVRF